VIESNIGLLLNFDPFFYHTYLSLFICFDVTNLYVEYDK